MSDTTVHAAPPADAATTAPRRLGLIAALGVWGALGFAMIGIIFFGGYDGRPVGDLSTLNPLKHHTLFGPALLMWTALSAMGIPRALLAISQRD